MNGDHPDALSLAAQRAREQEAAEQTTPAPAVGHQPLMHRVGAKAKSLSYMARCACGWEGDWRRSANEADLDLSAHMGGNGRWSPWHELEDETTL